MMYSSSAKESLLLKHPSETQTHQNVENGQLRVGQTFDTMYDCGQQVDANALQPSYSICQSEIVSYVLLFRSALPNRLP